MSVYVSCKRSFAVVVFAGLFAVATLGAAPTTDESTVAVDRRAQVTAASADALVSIERDVMSTRITPSLTVEQFVRKTDSRDAIAKSIRGAEQIGGTRWLDDSTCQVRMELPGTTVADAIVEVAKSKSKEAGMPADVMRERLWRMRDNTFAATGMSTCAIDRLRPPAEQTNWRGIPEDAIKAAVKEAKHAAVQQVLGDVGTIQLPNSNDKLGKTLSDQKVNEALEKWLMKRPVTSVDFRDDLEVRLSVAVEGDSFWDQLVGVVGDRKDVSFPSDEKSRDELRRKVVGRVVPIVGRAVAKGKSNGVPQPRVSMRVDLPREAPVWVGEQVDVRGNSRPVDGQLKTARAAENAAREQLKIKIEELSLGRDLMLGDAAKLDDRIRGAIDRAVQRVRPRKISYLSDGSAEVSLSLELRDLWYELEK